MNRIFNIEQAANFLNISQGRLLELCDRDDIEYMINLYGEYFFYEKDLRNYRGR